uniref:Uncharacterized protein n=1 Tax=Parascaris equorum TaxID=6256 RepID=A0A914RK86_PAREQ
MWLMDLVFIPKKCYTNYFQICSKFHSTESTDEFLWREINSHTL